MTRFSTRLVSGTLMVAVAAGEGLLSAGVATAAPPAGTQGSLTITPAVGTDNSIVNARTSSGCPTTAAGAATFVEGPIGAPNPTFPHENPFTIVTPGGRTSPRPDRSISRFGSR